MAGDLTRSGLLYAGNHNDWVSTVAVALRDCNIRPTISFTRGNEKTICVGRLIIPECPLARAIIRQLVSAVLWQRLPDHVKTAHLNTLLIHLQRLAKPFRLLDLPTELRLGIYAFVVKPITVVVGFGGKPTYQDLQMAYVSRQTRVEALLVFCENTMLTFDFQFLDTSRPISSWTTTYSSAKILDLLRTAELGVYIQHNPSARGARQICKIKLSYTPRDGFQALYPKALQLRALLQTHFEAIEHDHEQLGMQGEAIILAMTSNSKLWDYGTLMFGH